MSIKIVKEPPEMFKYTRAYERCFFCNLETDMWNKKTNTPVCPHCAENHSPDELPGAKILVRPGVKKESI